MNDTPSHSPRRNHHQQQQHIPYSNNMEPQKCVDFEVKNKPADIPQTSFLSCYVCYKNIIQEESNPSSIIILECRHSFHPHCLEQTFTRQINSNSFPISCPLADCQQEPPMFLLSSILPHSKFQACLEYEKSLCPSIKQNTCFHCGQRFLSDTSVAFHKCIKCKSINCLRCHKQYHPGKKCSISVAVKQIQNTNKLINTLIWTAQLPKETTKKEQLTPRTQNDTSSMNTSQNSNQILLQNPNLKISFPVENLPEQKSMHSSKNSNPVDFQQNQQSNFYQYNTYQQQQNEQESPAGYQLPELFSFNKRRMSHEYNKSHSFGVSPTQRSTSRSSKQDLSRNYSNLSHYKNISVINESSLEQQTPTATANKSDQFLSAIRKYANRKLQMQPSKQSASPPAGSKRRGWNNNSPQHGMYLQKTSQLLNNSVGFDGYNPERGFSQKRFMDCQNTTKGNNHNATSRKNSNKVMHNSNKSINQSNHNNSVDSHSKFKVC